MDNHIKLSIVIPCLADGEDMLKLCQRCLDSIKHGTDAGALLPQIEVILVDDESPIQGLDKLDTTSLPNFRYVRNEHRLGIGGSRNVGLSLAQGDFVHYLDADDYLVNDYLVSLLGHIDEDNRNGRDIQMYLISFLLISQNNQGKRVVERTMMDLKDPVFAPISSCFKVVRRDKCVPHSNAIYLEDVEYHFRQMDAIDDMKRNVSMLADKIYMCYDNTRPLAYTRTSDFLITNHFTLEQLATNDILPKRNLKDRAVSDVLRAVAALYDLRLKLKHSEVKRACLIRMNLIWNKVLTNTFVH